MHPLITIAAACAIMGLAPSPTPAADALSASVSSLAEHEGFSPVPYLCSRGYLTIGYGRRLGPEYIAHAPIDREQAYKMLWEDAEKAEAGARRVYPDFDVLPAAARQALIEMSFQLGATGLAKFVNLKKAIQHRRWKDAGSECLHSHWHTQTPKRAQHCAALFGGIK